MKAWNASFHAVARAHEPVRRRSPLHRLPSGGAILCFHSITPRRTVEHGDVHLTLEDFASCVRIARRWGEFVPLSELLARHLQGKYPWIVLLSSIGRVCKIGRAHV